MGLWVSRETREVEKNTMDFYEGMLLFLVSIGIGIGIVQLIRLIRITARSSSARSHNDKEIRIGRTTNYDTGWDSLSTFHNLCAYKCTTSVVGYCDGVKVLKRVGG